MYARKNASSNQIDIISLMKDSHASISELFLNALLTDGFE